jgi:hypothetical protein
MSGGINKSMSRFGESDRATFSNSGKNRVFQQYKGWEHNPLMGHQRSLKKAASNLRPEKKSHSTVSENELVLRTGKMFWAKARSAFQINK